ncbi:MAG: GNAT family N-acetyltransferase [Dehalococcoidia bacterium]
MRDLTPGELSIAAGVLGRAYRDTPTTIALLGDDRELRMRVTGDIMGWRVSLMNPPALAAHRADSLVGVCGLAPSDAPPPAQKQEEELGRILRQGGRGVVQKAIDMAAEWARRAPKERHWHLGPVAVEPDLMGRGIGSRMIERFCVKMDAEGEMAYLETDLSESVRLYERFGFATVDEGPVIGVHNWFMIRPAPGTSRS